MSGHWRDTDAPSLRIFAPTQGVSVTAVTANHFANQQSYSCEGILRKLGVCHMKKLNLIGRAIVALVVTPNFCGVYG
jgi:hypothetical protein